jgi:hypothetical protein
VGKTHETDNEQGSGQARPIIRVGRRRQESWLAAGCGRLAGSGRYRGAAGRGRFWDAGREAVVSALGPGCGAPGGLS